MNNRTAATTLFLSGDVMLGRGIDQIMPFPSDPRLHEPYVGSALDYVHLAEQVNGAIPRNVPEAYVWGDLLSDLDALAPQARIINLETAVTTSDTALAKGINYRMNPGNVGCLTAAAIDCCVLANNHLLDWGVAGLIDTLEALDRQGILIAGAGRNAAQAAAPATFELTGGRRLLVFAFGATTSGIPLQWAAGADRPGIALLPDLSTATAAGIVRRILDRRQPEDLVVVSIHWGPNWGYRIGGERRAFAHALIDAGACDVLHGHSSHHPVGMEIHRGRLILYGCGDLLNDYEGIGGYESFRGDLSLGYVPRLSPAGELEELVLLPYRIRRFRLERAAPADAEWLRSTLERESAASGCRFTMRGGAIIMTGRDGTAGQP